ncbi:MAG: hypothetical protein AAFY72_14175, partial [Cyanobacteria bacterium J06649_4]
MRDTISAIDHFSQLSEDQLDRLLSGSEIKEYAAGESILSADESPSFYSFLIQGRWWMQRRIVGVLSLKEWIDE